MNGATARNPAAAIAGIAASQVYGVSGKPWTSSTSGPVPCSRYPNFKPFAVTNFIASLYASYGSDGFPADTRVYRRPR